MARRISPSQLQSKLRQAESSRRQAIEKYNREVRQRNQRARSAVNKFNRDMQSAVTKHNSAVRAHNARVRADRQRVRQGLARLRARSATGRYPTFRVSVEALHDAYVRYESQVGSEPADRRHAELLDLAERGGREQSWCDQCTSGRCARQRHSGRRGSSFDADHRRTPGHLEGSRRSLARGAVCAKPAESRRCSPLLYQRARDLGQDPRLRCSGWSSAQGRPAC